MRCRCVEVAYCFGCLLFCCCSLFVLLVPVLLSAVFVCFCKSIFFLFFARSARFEARFEASFILVARRVCVFPHSTCFARLHDPHNPQRRK